MASSGRPTAVLASFEAPHNQSGAELVNLTLALEALDRIVIPPYAQLSFNDATGPRLAERGYQAGLMFSQGKVVKGLGGGVCVASTALYNAALLGGLPIIERWMHSGLPSYAGPTRDAAVVFGHKDLVIKNSLSEPLWVRTFVEGKNVRISLLTLRPRPYEVRLVESGKSFIASPLKIQPREEFEDQATAAVPADKDNPEVLSPGAPGCDLKLVRELWQNGKRVKTELIAHDVRAPRPRVLALPDASDGPEFNAPDSLTQPLLPQTALPVPKSPVDASPVEVKPHDSLSGGTPSDPGTASTSAPGRATRSGR